ncbi:hypothetical protein HHL17_32800 [Chitinophaga sp. G-6-1-13]|uniref:Uncharacterized protein n=1 Tax=Chitinophaga fulva TaxID=2728842 RepID=A0A848GX60_9BACT|nr:hypothetical protein [Chitinophaga fulva]NML42011.1 hypothetical protein [Chitinophaga fulva]
MWSPLYWYYEIRSDRSYSQRILTGDVLNVLNNTGELQRIDKQEFGNIERFPWISVVAVNSNNGNYATYAGYKSRWINLIAVVGSKSDPRNETLYVSLLARIAEKLNWELILEEDEDGNEDVVLREKLLQ